MIQVDQQFIKDFVKITPHNEARKPLMSIEQRTNLNNNIQLAIQQAQIALVQGNETLYRLNIENAIEIAQDFGASETLIGLTLVAFGTSLPELATTLMAAMRRHADVALGNVIGSNLFNLLGIIGVTSLFGVLPVSDRLLHFDLWVMLVSSVVLLPFPVLKWPLSRVWGGVFTFGYVFYIWTVLQG